MSKMTNQVQDAFEFLTHDQRTRAGEACARINDSLQKGVAPEALAAQLTANERKNNPTNPEVVTVQDVESAAKMFRISKSRQVLPKTQAAELVKVANQDQEADIPHPIYQT